MTPWGHWTVPATNTRRPGATGRTWTCPGSSRTTVSPRVPASRHVQRLDDDGHAELGHTSCSSKPHDTQKEQMDNVDDWHNQCGWYFEGWRRRNYNISKVDGDASTGGAWSEADLGVWGRYLNPRDKCFDAQKNKTSAWGGNAPTTETECKEKEVSGLQKIHRRRHCGGTKMFA